MKNKLTEKQNTVLFAIEGFVEKKGFSPTLEELKKILKSKKLPLKSNNSLIQYLSTLEDKGYIQRFNKPRGIRLLSSNIKNFISVPLLGNANCGEALSFADNYIEDYIDISKEYIKGDCDDYFFVKAIGDSMDRAGINNGDLVLAKRFKGDWHPNKIVVATINGLGTIKRYQEVGNAPMLIPDSTNERHQPIILHLGDELCISGEVEKVFKLSSMGGN